MSLDPKGATTLTDVIRRRAALTPDAQYFSLFDDVVTYERLWAMSARYAAGLAAAGIGAGDKLCLIYPTCAEFFYTFLGALRLGAVPVPLYPTLASTPWRPTCAWCSSPTSSITTARRRQITSRSPPICASCSTRRDRRAIRAASC